MSMNQFMHPRNLYKSPPDFKRLAIEYPEFREHVKQDVTGKITIDFKDVEALRALSRTLLKKDFGLEVEMPANKLIPTIPLRLNYILWIEDLLSISGGVENIKGVDIGTGASCVYPLICAKQYRWSMLATENDAESIKYAVENVTRNNLEGLITVKRVQGDSLLKEAVDPDLAYDFCMCNPPFFSSSQELHPFFKARKDNRPRPRNGFCAAVSEVVTKGGEIEFVSKLIQESKGLQKQIRIYSTMIGHKSSLSPLKKLLREMDVVSFKQTEFCQGFTTRWGLAWTFCDIDLRKVPLDTLTASKKQKTKPLVYNIEQDEGTKNLLVKDVAEKLKQIFTDLQINFEEIKNSKNIISLIITALSNTWSHQRRKRREQKRLQALLENDSITPEKCAKTEMETIMAETSPSPEMQNTSNLLAELRVNSPENCAGAKRTLEEDCEEYYKCKKMRSAAESCSCNASDFYLKSMVVVRRENNSICIEMIWLEGTANKDVLHQVLQCVKNNFKFD